MAEKIETGDVQMVAFKLANEEFAIEIQQVREVLKMTRVTLVPQAAYYLEGVINLRGEVIPVVDLRKFFELAQDERNEQTRIIIVEVKDSDVGLIVDSVTEVLRFTGLAIQPPPSRVTGARTDLIKGVGKVDERLLIVLDLEKILSTEEGIDFDEG